MSSFSIPLQKTQKLALKESDRVIPIESEKQETSNGPQTESEEQEAPYTPIPGQTTVEDFEEVLPKGASEPAASPSTDRDAVPDGENVVDAEYRELSVESAAETQMESAQQQPAAEETYTYTDIEIKNAISYFDIEYLSRMGVQQDATKCRNYKIALECIRRCYPSIAEQTAE